MFDLRTPSRIPLARSGAAWVIWVACLLILAGLGLLLYARFVPSWRTGDEHATGTAQRAPPTPRYETDEVGAVHGVFDPAELASFWEACGLPRLAVELPRIERGQCEMFRRALFELRGERSAENLGWVGLFPLFWGFPELAEQIFQLAHQVDPRDYRWPHYIAYATQRSTSGPDGDADVAKAESYYRKAIELDPGKVGSYLQLGRLLMLSDRFEEARAVFETATGVDPANPYAYGELGNLAHLRGDYSAAERYCLESLERDPANSRAHVLLSRIYDEQLDHDKARYHARMGETGMPFADPVPDDLVHDMRLRTDALVLLSARAFLQFQRKDYARLVAIAEQIAERDPRVERRLQLSEAYRLNRQLEDSRQVCMATLERYPEYPRCHLMLARIELSRQQWQAALDKAQDAIARDRHLVEAHRIQARAHHMLARSESREEHMARALEAIEEAIELDPGDSENHWWRGRMYFDRADQLGRRASTEAEFERVVQAMQRAVDGYAAAVRLDPANKEYEQALRTMESNLERFIEFRRSRPRGLGNGAGG